MSDRAPRNRTLTCTSEERLEFADTVLRVEGAIHLQDMVCQLIEADFFEIAALLPKRFVDLLILDPPYNLTKDFHGRRFRKRDSDGYRSWFRQAMDLLIPMTSLVAPWRIWPSPMWKGSTLLWMSRLMELIPLQHLAAISSVPGIQIYIIYSRLMATVAPCIVGRSDLTLPGHPTPGSTILKGAGR